MGLKARKLRVSVAVSSAKPEHVGSHTLNWKGEWFIALKTLGKMERKVTGIKGGIRNLS
jgi:hypothetical protein